MSVRSAAKAIIINDGKILLNKCNDSKNGEYYSLPGGGQNTYETLSETLVRECMEETGYKVKPVRFAALCEEICTNIDFREKHPEYAHKMNHIFICELASADTVLPTEIDSSQVGCEWINIDNLDSIRILPKAVGANIQELIKIPAAMFLGSEYVEFNHG